MTAITHDRWGPNGLAVEQIIRRAATMTADECRRLASAWDAFTAPDPADSPLDFGDTDPWQAASDDWNDAEEAMDRAVTAAGRAEEVRDAGRAGWDAVGHTDPAGRVAAPLAADTAATAVAAVGLVGTEGFTAAHFDLLLGPWRAVFGDQGETVCECGGE